MKRLVQRRPSPSLLLSIAAVLIALGGQAGALPGKKSVKKGDIAKGAVTSRAIASGAVGARALGPVVIRTVVDNPGDAIAGDGAFAGNAPFPTARCQSGEQMMSGGGQFNTAVFPNGNANERIQFLSSFPYSNRWEAGRVSDDGPGSRFTVAVVCLKR
jgi:hypothetical protein